MFPYYVPAIIGLLFAAMSIFALVHSEQYHRRWPWLVALLASLLLWVPALVLFVAVPLIWPQVNNGRSDAYYRLMGWEVAWIFLGLPLGFISALICVGVGQEDRRGSQTR